MSRTRSYRRFKQFTKVERRIKIFVRLRGWGEFTTVADFSKAVKEGKSCIWMRTQTTPCSCFCCKGDSKYKRPILSELKKLIQED